MLVPVVDAVMVPVARQVAALPAAKGPRAMVHWATSATRARPLDDARSVHAVGRVEIQRPSRAVRMQDAMSEPAVVRPTLVARHVATLPAA